MSDVSVEFGAVDVGLDKTLKAVQAEMTTLQTKIKSGDLAFGELEQTMKKLGQAEGLEKKLKSMGTDAAGTSPKIDALGGDLKAMGAKAEDAGDKGNLGLGKIGIAAGVAGAAVKIGMKAVELATDAARAVVDQFGAAIDLGGKLNDLSSRTGESAGNLLILERAFTNTGVSADAVGTSMNKMQKFMVDAAQGGAAQSDAMARLGVTMGDLSGKTPTEQMGVFAQRISSIQDPAQRAEAAMSIFGKSGGELLPILQNFSGEIEGAKGQLGGLPGVMDRSAAAFDGVGDNMAALNTKVLEFAAGFLESALPALNAFTSALSGVDAAGWGQAAMDWVLRVADTMIGAFKNPLVYIETYINSFDVMLATVGNGLLNGAMTFIDFIVKSMSTDLPSAIGGFITTSLVDAALTFDRYLVEALMTFSAAIAEIPGFEAAGQKMLSVLSAANDEIMSQQLDNMGKSKDAAAQVVTEFGKAAEKTTVFKNDFFGAEEATKRMNAGFATMEASGKETRENFLGAEGSTSNTASNIQNAATNSQVAAINFDSVNSSAYTSNEHVKKAASHSVDIEKSWAKVAGSAYTAEQSTYGAQAAMAKAVREMSDKDLGKLFTQARQDLRDMGGDMKTVGDEARNIPELAEALGIETAGKSAKQMIYEIGQEIKVISNSPIEINIKFSPEVFAAGLESLRTDASNAFQQVPLDLDAAKSIAEQATAAAEGFKNPIPLNLKGYESIADARKSAEDNFANAIPLTLSGDSAANEVLGVVQNRLSTVIPLSLDGEGAGSTIGNLASGLNNLGTPVNLSLDGSSASNAVGSVKTDISTLGAQQKINLDGASAITSIRDDLKSGIELDVSAKSGVNGILEELKTLVSDIKTLVGKIEPKLPVAALTA